MALGHNSDRHPAEGYINRIAALEEEVAGLRSDIRDIYKEAKDAGHLKSAIRMVVKRKMEDEDERLSHEAIESEAEQIMAALGMLADTPLGEAAAEQPRRRRRKNAEDQENDMPEA
jgi:uncharacterized protein (UPF0335 family)